MPNRYLREGILTSKRIAKLSWPAEVFYRRVMSVVDDFGRYYATPMLLRAACYPLQLDKVSDDDVRKWLGETRKADLVGVYESGGESYLELKDFRQQVRAKNGSKYPQPPPSAKQLPSACVADDQHMRTKDEDEDEDEVSGERQAASPPPVALIPLHDGTDFGIPAELADQWRSTFQAVDVMQELREMRAWCLANPAKRKTRRGVTGFIVRWLGKEQDRGGSGNVVPLKADKFVGVM